MAFHGQKPGQAAQWELDNPQAREMARYAAGERLDLPRILAVAREFSKALAIFRPPEGYQPEPAPPESPLTSSMARALGAPTLTEYFERTLAAQKSSISVASHREAPLPRGPEAVPGALAAIEEAQAGYEAADPHIFKKILGELAAIRASLLRAQSLGRELESLVGLWPPDSLEMLRRAQRLEEAAKSLTLVNGALSEEGGPALTELTRSLLARLTETRAALDELRRWGRATRLFLEGLDSLKAALQAGSGPGLDWAARLRGAETKLSDLTNQRQTLLARRQETDHRLAAALSEVERAESSLVGAANSVALKRGEALVANVEALWRGVVARRTALAEAWLSLKPLVGRPIFLEKIFLATALNLGRAQAALEELRVRLAQRAGSLSSSQNLRLAAREALALERDKGYPASLTQAQRRLGELRELWKSQVSRANRVNRASEDSLAQGPLAPDSLAQAPPAWDYLARESLAASSATTHEDRSLAVISEQLAAVAAERDRAREELLGLKESLAEAGQAKARLMKLVERARRALKEVSQERAQLRELLTENEREAALARRRHAKLAEQYNYGRAQFRKLAQISRDRQSQGVAERQELAESLAKLETELRVSLGERKTLAAKSQELALSLDQARGQEAALTAELATHQEELAEASRSRERLGQIITGYRGQLDRLLVAQRALQQAWRRRGVALAQSELELEERKVQLAKSKKALILQVTRRQRLLAELGASRAKLEGLESERTRLNQEIEAARAATERARDESQRDLAAAQRDLAEARATEERLQTELVGLRQEMDGNLKPLIQLLGLALWRGEAERRLAAQAAQADLSRQRQEAAAREAGLRIAGAGREIDYLDRLAQKDKELEKIRAERDDLELERGSLLEGQAQESQAQGWLVNQLSVALAASDLRHEKLTRGLRNLQSRLVAQKAEARTFKVEIEELVKNQAQALHQHQAWLSELVPLVGFFLESGLDFWARGPASGDARQAVLFFLREENASLAQELARLREDRQGLWAERLSLLETQAGFKERLRDLRGLVGFLLRQFTDNAVSLAQAWGQRDTLLAQIATLHAAQKSGATEGALSPEGLAPAKLSQTQEQRERLERLELENNLLKGQMDRAESELEKRRNEARELAEAKKLLEGSLAERERMVQSLSQESEAQVAQLRETQAQANRLAVDNQRLSQTADRQAAELAKGQAELRALRSSPRQDGQLEAVWGALNYLGARSSDSLEDLRERLSLEARRLEEAQRELRAKEETIKALENRQDTLALLYWTVVQMSADGQLTVPAGLTAPALTGQPDSVEELDEELDGELEEDQAEPTAGESRPRKTGEKGGFLAGGLLAELRKAAKKSLFSLILAGGLVLCFPEPGQAEPLALGSPQTPLVSLGAQVSEAGLAKSDQLALSTRLALSARVAPSTRPAPSAWLVPVKGPDYSWPCLWPREPGRRPLGHFSGEERWESQPAPSGLEPGPLATRARFRALNRVIDLGFLQVEELTQGLIETRAMGFMESQASKWGLSLEVWLRLVRRAYDKDQTVFLADLASEETPMILMRPYFPKMTSLLRRCDFKEVLGQYVLPRLDGLPDLTAEFWDRLFLDFYQRMAEPEEAALGLAWHLARRSAKAPPLEFGGQLGPPRELDEKLAPERIVEALAEYILFNWPAVASRRSDSPDGRQAARVARDLYAVGRVFQTPWTFLAALAQESRERGAPWPTTLEIYGAAREVADRTRRSSRQWAPGEPALCDLDLLVSSWPKLRLLDLRLKRLALVNYFSTLCRPAQSLFG
ncbi:MAG: hypothetical protein LBR11_09635 [Deltaproteobacteria bacterium]|jgi:chromosome segregation ATPase|nr:hypothetical protein [Deltaproteobacteria bacterium]